MELDLLAPDLELELLQERHRIETTLTEIYSRRARQTARRLRGYREGQELGAELQAEGTLPSFLARRLRL